MEETISRNINWKQIESETKTRIKAIIESKISISEKMKQLNQVCWKAFDLFIEHGQPTEDDALDEAIMIFIDNSMFEESEESRYNRLITLVAQFE